MNALLKRIVLLLALFGAITANEWRGQAISVGFQDVTRLVLVIVSAAITLYLLMTSYWSSRSRRVDERRQIQDEIIRAVLQGRRSRPRR
jgi:hypothetical protein